MATSITLLMSDEKYIFFTQVKPAFPDWVTKFVNVSHLMITFSCSSNFYIYFVKYGGRKALRAQRQIIFKFKFMSPETSPPQMSGAFNSIQGHSQTSQATVGHL